ncbi:glutathione peroxidase [Bryocella elongata]|uniref:Glutathione peroxidase n=1 Tax=Bryocella elongata TaxID=863522 RepID=A0A1H5TA09_9BACT|nr:glutathione peroxidase [Bryocella elongata]SEF58827.1 glutathione peroxidase [Bryocella elongata]
MSTLYDIELTTIDGKTTSLKEYSGKALLLVNVASKCGFTKQYTGLEALYQEYKDRGLVVFGFPANDFAGQEPGTNEEIAAFCSTEYPVTFPIFAKLTVNGPEQHPIYTALTAAMPQHDADSAGLRGGLDSYLASQGLPLSPALPAVLWNFEKFVVARDGSAVARYASDVEPSDPRLIEAIEKALL